MPVKWFLLRAFWVFVKVRGAEARYTRGPNGDLKVASTPDNALFFGGYAGFEVVEGFCEAFF